MFHLLHLKSYSIYDQLVLEESLLRHDERNWCLINEGTPPAIVMGISGKKEELVDCARAHHEGIPLIKRFSGGGTVFVDEQTLFVTFICNKNFHPFPAYPEPIMRWTEEIYKEVFDHQHFSLRENDYVIGEKKVGGNAQYIKKERWLHHTSFLWNYSQEKMNILLLPKKRPSYRNSRSHNEFLSTLSSHFPCKNTLIEQLKATLNKRYLAKACDLDDILSTVSLEQSPTTGYQPIHPHPVA
jgi:lipoate-protein ligase A